MEILRRQMSENLEKLRRAGNAAAGSRALPQVASRSVAASLRQTLARRIGSVDARDPQFQERATALFVESILVAEFGEELVNDPGFRLMIREVARTMGAEPAIAEDLARLFAELRDAGT
jgi:hypothetical protein